MIQEYPSRGVERLALSHFRSYSSFNLSLDSRPVVLTGPNGIGKTNLLEALSFLIPGRGLRRAPLKEVKKQGSLEPWAISVHLKDEGQGVQIGTGQDPENFERRISKINGEKVKSQAVLSEWMSMVWLTPQMDRLFLDGPQGRRQFVDRLVYGLLPSHAGRLNRYEKALRERNFLLRQGRYDRHWIAGLEETLVREGVPITLARQDMMAELQAAVRHQEPIFPQADLCLRGDIETLLQTHKPGEGEDEMRRLLSDNRENDRLTGRTSTGPHRSDLIVTYVEKNQAAELCSTGEQKALLLSIVMASAHLLSVKTGAIPLLLLDEVVAHLDGGRRAALFQAILNLKMQTWLTGTDAALFEGLQGNAQFIELGAE